MGAAILGTRLWFTTYDKPTTRFVLHSSALDGSSPPSTHETLRSSQLFVYRGHLVTDGRFTDTISEDCATYCYLDDPNRRLIAVVDKDGGQQVLARNLASGKSAILMTGDVVSVAPTRGNVTIYAQDRIVVVPAADLP
jgi:hypothetical protein